jgi:hypothetical protein
MREGGRMTPTATAARGSRAVQPPPDAAARHLALSPPRALAFPFAFTLALALVGLMPDIRRNPPLFWSFIGTSGVLVAWTCGLLIVAKRRLLTVEVVLRKQHYLQACAQGSVLLYWGWYWRPVYDAVPLVVAQLLFAYAFDMLLAWSHRDTYSLGFGQFPVIFSINLFLWFKPDWFYLQFLMVAVGFAAKDLVRWTKEGRRTHIFNPSSFPLALCSIALFLTGATRATWGEEIATTQFYPPHIYAALFLAGLPGQFLFGVTTMTMSAVLTTYGFGLAYYLATGTYFFIDSYIPIAVFLGMHLLFTDPSTSPRTELGRIVFGIMYGLSVIVAYELLGRAGLPTFYDKLLPVPILNLTIRGLDRAARSTLLTSLDPCRLGRSLTPRQRNLAYMSIWSAAFVAMTAAGGVGDTHRGHWLPFWQKACEENRRHACENLGVIELAHCRDGSGWACNELGALIGERRLGSASVLAGVLHNISADPAAAFFRRACSVGLPTGCENQTIHSAGRRDFRHVPPRPADYPILLREGKGALPDRTVSELLTRGCNQGWTGACEDLARLKAGRP